jgi:cellulose biosynthesis protein BcsQ
MSSAGRSSTNSGRRWLSCSPTRWRRIRPKKVFDIDLALQKNVGTVEGLDDIDLLPSSLGLIDVQDRVATMPVGRYFTKSQTDILQTAVKNILGDYDVVLIDCPPNMGIITLNGLRIADGYVIPTIPDVLSTYGIPQIARRVADFARELNEDIELYGIIITKYRAASTLHVNTIHRLRADAEDGKNPLLFDTLVPEGNAIAAAAKFTGRGTLRQKYAYQGGYERRSSGWPTKSRRRQGSRVAVADVMRLRELCEQLVQRAEAEPAGAPALVEAVAKLLEGSAGEEKSAGRRTGRRAAPLLDPFEIYRDDPDALPGRLAELDLEQLRDVVAHFGMDPRRLVMKWKTPDRVIGHVVETVQTRSRKGDAFRAPTPGA